MPSSESDPSPTFFFEGLPAGGAFSPIYLDRPQRNTAAVNAGDYGLYVGGGAINWAFADEFNKHIFGKHGLEHWIDKKCSLYEYMHRKSLELAVSKGEVVFASEALSKDQEYKGCLDKLGLAACFAAPGYDGKEGEFGSVCIDVFKPGYGPRNEKNVAMAYIVGPLGAGCSRKVSGVELCAEKQDFLARVEGVAVRAIETVAFYNKMVKDRPDLQQLPPIEDLRWCLVSGGVYRHHEATKLDVARATLRAMNGVRLAEAAEFRVTFTYDNGDLSEPDGDASMAESVFKKAAELEGVRIQEVPLTSQAEDGPNT